LPSEAATAASAACHLKQASGALPAVVAGAIAGKAATLRGSKPKQAGDVGGLAARAAGGSPAEVSEVTWLATVAAAQWRLAGNTSVGQGAAAAAAQQQQIQQQLHRQGGGLETKLQALEADLAAAGGHGTSTGDGRRLAKQIRSLKRRLEELNKLDLSPRLVGRSVAYESVVRNPPAVVPSREAAGVFAAALLFAPIPPGTAVVNAMNSPRPGATTLNSRASISASGKMKAPRTARPGRRLVSRPPSASGKSKSKTRQPTRPRSAPAAGHGVGTGRSHTPGRGSLGKAASASPRTPQPRRMHPEAMADVNTREQRRWAHTGGAGGAAASYTALQARGPAGAGGMVVRVPAPAALASAHLGTAGRRGVRMPAVDRGASARLRSNDWGRGEIQI
jgi:hypothetical protein